MEKPLRVQLFGESIKIHKIGFSTDSLVRFKAILSSIDEPIELALLDPFFYHKLRNPAIQSIQDLICSSYGGLMNTNKSQIEIWRGRKRLAKLKLEEIIRPKTLFPLFSVETNSIDIASFGKGIFFEEQEIGLLGTYKLESQNFNVDFLRFEILKMNYLNVNMELLDGIIYKDQKMVSIKSDTLVTGQRCFKIECS